MGWVHGSLGGFWWRNKGGIRFGGGVERGDERGREGDGMR